MTVGKIRNESPRVRTATEIINQAIRENRVAEVLLYLFAAIVMVCGTIVLLYGAFSRQGLTALAGAISNTLFLPAINYAGRIRKENIAIRLLEAPLSTAQTAVDAAKAIRENFLSIHSVK